MLVVEGAEDVVAVKAILPTLSEVVSQALRQNTLVIAPIAGAGNLSYKLSMLASALCSTHVLLDHDAAGRLGYEKAEADGFLDLTDLTLIRCKGMANSEMEDCFEVGAYAGAVKAKFGVDLTLANFRGNGKWSDRAKDCFEVAGKPWGDRIKAQLKDIVARAVAATPKLALNAHKRAALDALVVALEGKLGSVPG